MNNHHLTKEKRISLSQYGGYQLKKKKKLKRKRLNLGQQKAKMHAIFFLLFLFFNTKELLTTQ